MRPAPSVDGPSRARDASESIARDPFHQAIPLVTPVVDLPRPRRASCPLVRFGCFMPADVLRTRVTRHDRWSGLLSLGHWRGAGEDSAGSGHLPDRRSDGKPRMLRPRLMRVPRRQLIAGSVQEQLNGLSGNAGEMKRAVRVGRTLQQILHIDHVPAAKRETRVRWNRLAVAETNPAFHFERRV